MSESDKSSHSGASSGASSGTGASELSARQRESDKLGQDASVNDLLEDNKGLQDGIFQCMHVLTKGKAGGGIRMALFKLFVEGIQIFFFLFNAASSTWLVDAKNPVYEYLSWIVLRLPISMYKGYSMYITIFYVLVALVWAIVALTVWVATLMRKQDHAGSALNKLIKLMQLSAEWVLGLFYIAVFDYLVFILDCTWADLGSAKHVFFQDVQCLAMPHLIHAAVAAVTILVFAASVLCLSVAGCNLNPMTHSYGASPCPRLRIKLMGLKILLVVCGSAVDAYPLIQAIGMLIALVWIVWSDFIATPYYWPLVNHYWFGFWTAMLYVMLLFFTAVVTNQRLEVKFANAVLYGIFPVLLGGMGVSYLRLAWLMRPVDKFRNPPPGIKLKKIHRFATVEEVEVVARVSRKWDEDGIPDQEASDLGETILKAGLESFQSNPTMFILYANFLIEARKDGQGARTNLQLASKNSPDLIDRYFIYASQELSKTLKSEQQGGYDLSGYVEFQRNYRAAITAHKTALMAQHGMWRELMHDNIQFVALQDRLAHVDAAERQATQVYQRVMERYPGNGKLLRAYGKFLEDVKHDPWGANRQYQEALKVGLGDSMINLGSYVGKDGKQQAWLSSVDEKVDGIVVANAQGNIIMVNQTLSRMLGYERGELDGKNVTVLMPAAFSQRHASYMQRYATTGEAHILDTQREVLAVHKDHNVMPISIGIMKMSGTGNDSMFLAVIQLAPQVEDMARMWIMPTGQILCAEPLFEDWFGRDPRGLMGKTLWSITPEADEMHAFVDRCEAAAAAGTFRDEDHMITTRLIHGFMGPVHVTIQARLAGTPNVCLLRLEVRLVGKPTALLVVNHKGSISHASASLGALLGYSSKALAKMNLEDIIPVPYAQLHKGWIKACHPVPAPTSCRSGRVVHFSTHSGSTVPVRLDISNHEQDDQMEYVVKVARASDEESQSDLALELVLAPDGTVQEVVPSATAALFGFKSEVLLGKPLRSFVNVVREYCDKYGQDATPRIMDAMAEKSSDSPGICWRVGVHSPLQLNAEGKVVGSVTAKQLKAASLQLQAVRQNEDDLDEVPRIVCRLRRADLMAGTLEISSSLRVSKADPVAAQLFGRTSLAMKGMKLGRLLQLPERLKLVDLVRKGPKGAMKSHSSSAWMVGPVKEMTGSHSDGGPIIITMQAVGREVAGQGLPKITAEVKAVAFFKGDLAMLERLVASHDSDTKDGAERVLRRFNSSSSSDDEAASRAGRAVAHTVVVRASPRLVLPGKPAARSPGPAFQQDEEDEQHSAAGSDAEQQPLLKTAAIDRWVPPMGMGALGAADDPPDAGSEAGGDAIVQLELGRAKGVVPLKKDPPSEAEGSEGGGSQGIDAASAMDGASSAGGSEADKAEEDLTADFRRAKRLKKLKHMLAGTAAESAARRFAFASYAVMGVLLAVHLACFVIFDQQVQQQHTYVYEVDQMGALTDKVQLVNVRTLVLQRCQLPKYANTTFCSLLPTWLKSLEKELQLVETAHQGIYLGFDHLRPFSDEKLYKLWTDYNSLPAQDYSDISGTFTDYNTSTWQLGNDLISAGREVLYWSDILKGGLNNSRAWQFVQENGQGAMFEGYKLSLDLMAKNAFTMLYSLHDALIILLVVEAVVVNVLALSYLFLLLKNVGAQHMRCFAPFLAVPSAVMRTMASRPCKVDDEDDDDADDVEDEDGAAAAQEAAKAAAAAAAQGKERKSVSMFVDEEPQPPAASGAYGFGNLADIEEGPHHASRARGPSTWSVVRKKARALYRRVVARDEFKMNGRKLLPHRPTLAKYMAPFVLWELAVVVIFAISFIKLDTVQEAIVALATGYRVVYRSTRVRLYCNQLVLAEDDAWRNYARNKLASQIDYLESEWKSLLYGGASSYSATSDFPDPSPATTFMSPAHSYMYFQNNQCVRADQSTCLKEDDKFYQVTHSGLDAMVQRQIQDGRLLVDDPVAALTVDNPRYEYVWRSSGFDLYNALEQASHQFSVDTLAAYDAVRQLHVILLVVTIFLMLGFTLLLFRPYRKRITDEATKVAGLLSLLPPECDVEGHVKTVMRKFSDAPGQEGAAAVPKA